MMTKSVPLWFVCGVAAVAQANYGASMNAGQCGPNFHMQVEARDERNLPISGLTEGGMRLGSGREPLQVISVQSLVPTSPDNAVTSLLIVVWPEAQIDAQGMDELLKALHAEEKVAWRVGVVSPSVQPLRWRSLSELQAPLHEAAASAFKVWVAPEGQQLREGQIPFRTWKAVVRGTAESLLTQPGRQVILEIVPRALPQRPVGVPGEEQLFASASFGSAPIYRLTRAGGLDASLSVPFGDASSGPPFGPGGNASPGAQNDAQLAGVRSAGFLDSIRIKPPQPAQLFGGTSLPSPRQIVHRIATDSTGSYSVVASTPAGCNPRALYPLTYTSAHNARKTHLYGPRSLYYPISRKHP